MPVCQKYRDDPSCTKDTLKKEKRAKLKQLQKSTRAPARGSVLKRPGGGRGPAKQDESTDEGADTKAKSQKKQLEADEETDGEAPDEKGSTTDADARPVSEGAQQCGSDFSPVSAGFTEIPDGIYDSMEAFASPS